MHYYEDDFETIKWVKHELHADNFTTVMGLLVISETCERNVVSFFNVKHAKPNFTKHCFTVASRELTNYISLLQDSLTSNQ